MKIVDSNPKDIIFALDVGTRSIIGTVGVIRDKKFNVICEKYEEHQERAMIDGQIHDINLVASTVNSIKKSIEEELKITLRDVSIAAAGRFLRTAEVKSQIEIDDDKEIDKEVIRSLELTAVKKAEEQISQQTEGKLYCVGYSVKNYYLNNYVISNLLDQKGENIAVDVIATFLPRSVVDSLYSVMDKVGLNVANITLEPIAAMEIAVPKNLRLLNIALVDVGAGTSDIAISSNDSISAYGMVPMAGDEVTEAIVQNYLVDFNMAEKIKRGVLKETTVQYTDILGMEGEAIFDEVNKIISPVVNKITDAVAETIVKLNGGKSPNAVFLVGGGAHTPNFKEFLAEKLNIQSKRIAVKGRDNILECVNYDETLGSTGITVLGIAQVAIKTSGNDFIDVVLNKEVISLFNSHKHNVMDVMLQAGLNHKLLVGKNGKNIRFNLNGIKRVAFGSLAESAKIKINGELATIDTDINEGDNIEVIYAKNGQDASPKVIEYVKNINSISFYMNDIIQNLEPIVFINGQRVELEEHIKENNNVEIDFPTTLGDYVKYNCNSTENAKYCLKENDIDDLYIIKDGDRIYKKKRQQAELEAAITRMEEQVVKEDTNREIETNSIENSYIEQNENSDEKIMVETLYNKQSEEYIIKNQIKITVNDEQINLKGKEKYVFIDIFDYINFDLTIAQGNLMLELNEKKAGYHDELNNGDIIKVFWEK